MRVKEKANQINILHLRFKDEMRNNSPRWNICENDELKIECKGKQIKSKLQSIV